MSCEAFSRQQPVFTSHSFPSAHGGEARLVRARPSGDIDQQPPVVYFDGGFGVQPKPYVGYLATKHGFDAVALVPERTMRRDRTYWSVNPISGEKRACQDRLKIREFATAGYATVAESQRLKAIDIATALDVVEADRAYLIGQSLGALSVTYAATQIPRRVDIVLPFPAGFVKPGSRDMIYRDSASYWRDRLTRKPVSPENSIEAFTDLNLAQGRVDRKRLRQNVVHDGSNAFLSFHAPLLDLLPKEDAVPSVTVIAGTRDYLFPPRHIEQSLAALQAEVRFVEIDEAHAIRDNRVVFDQVVRSIANARPTGSTRGLDQGQGGNSFI